MGLGCIFDKKYKNKTLQCFGYILEVKTLGFSVTVSVVKMSKKGFKGYTQFILAWTTELMDLAFTEMSKTWKDQVLS